MERRARFSIACLVAGAALATAGCGPQEEPTSRPGNVAASQPAAPNSPWDAAARAALVDCGAAGFRLFKTRDCEILVEESRRWDPAHEANRLSEVIDAVRRAFEVDFELPVPRLAEGRSFRAVLTSSTPAFLAYADRIRLDADLLPRRSGAAYDLAAGFLAFTDAVPVSIVAGHVAREIVERFRDRPSATPSLTAECLTSRYAGVARTAETSTGPTSGSWTFAFGRLGSEALRPGLWPRPTDLFDLGRLEESIRTADVFGARQAFRRAAWLLDHFMREFNVDAEGVVHPGTPGIYRDAWRRILRRNLLAGAPSMDLAREFAEAGLTLPELSERLLQWSSFLHRKAALNHVRGGLVIPWSDYRNTRGEASGQAADDLLASR